MRAGGRYGCARCGRADVPRTDLCDPLCAHARDENGNAPPPPSEQRFEWFSSGPEQVLPALVKPMFLLSVFLGRARARRKIMHLVGAAGPAEPIARVTDGLSCVEGTVEVLEPVRTPGGAPCAAYVRRTVREQLREGTKVVVEHVSVQRGTGRFVVKDETGVALVDDDWLRLFDVDGREPDPSRDGELLVRAGDRVRVVGYAHRGGVAALAGAASSLRGPPVGIRFEGGSRRPVCVFLLEVSDAKTGR